MKTNWIFLLICLIAIGTSCQKQTDYTPQINSLQKQIDDLVAQQSVINSLQSSLLNLQRRCDSLTIALIITNSNLQTTNNTVTSVSTSLNSLQAQVATIVGQISSLNSQINSTNVNVDNILIQLNSLNNQYIILVTQVNYIITQLTTVKDIEGNVYHTVTIGGQVWMMENLKTTKYRNGDPIANITDNVAWISSLSGAYCWYNNDTLTYKATYGALYNWYAVKDSRNIAPNGWHVPSDSEWMTLVNYLGGINLAGGKLKEIGNNHWASQNIGATNESGFTGLASGYRYYTGLFGVLGLGGNWWSSTEINVGNAWAWGLVWDTIVVGRGSNKEICGFSVRCIKD